MTPTNLAWTSSKSTTNGWPRSTESRPSQPSPTSGRRSRSSTRVSVLLFSANARATRVHLSRRAHLPSKSIVNQMAIEQRVVCESLATLANACARNSTWERVCGTRALKLGPCLRVHETCFTRQPTFDNKELASPPRHGFGWAQKQLFGRLPFWFFKSLNILTFSIILTGRQIALTHFVSCNDA